LDDYLLEADLRYDVNMNPNCFIVNALACRPFNQPNGPTRKPVTGEIENCRMRLQKLLRLAKPRILILMGNVACEAVFGMCDVPKKCFVDGVYVYRTTHPMAIVYDKSRIEEWICFWQYMKTLVKSGRRVKDFPALPLKIERGS
jgi:uracil-DNA glycosylase family 4